jgi:hypothetical protein
MDICNVITNEKITTLNHYNQDDLDDVMGNDDERFTDNCGWPGNERVTVCLL